jgi:hypothetical protein
MTETEEEMVIDEKNFDQYFFDIRTNKPKKGQIMARYCAMATFEKCNEKENIIDLISKTDKVLPAAQVMRKLLFASESDSIKVLKEMAKDYLETKDRDYVLNKPYKYKIEMFFYTELKYMPKNDPHWSTISILNLDQFEQNNGLIIKTSFTE